MKCQGTTTQPISYLSMSKVDPLEETKKIFDEFLNILHTVTKAKRNVQKLHLLGIEPTISSRRLKVGALDHSATKLVCNFGSTSDS